MLSGVMNFFEADTRLLLKKLKSVSLESCSLIFSKHEISDHRSSGVLLELKIEILNCW